MPRQGRSLFSPTRRPSQEDDGQTFFAMKQCEQCDAAMEDKDPHTACTICLNENHTLLSGCRSYFTGQASASGADFAKPFAMHSQEDRPNPCGARASTDTAHPDEALLIALGKTSCSSLVTRRSFQKTTWSLLVLSLPQQRWVT